MAQSARLLNLASVKSIMNNRVGITSQHVGKKFRLDIQGDGTVVDVKDKLGAVVLSQLPGEEGTVLRKKIFNARANSELAMKNPRNLAELKAGLVAEKAGDAQTAHMHFNNYLNACQISFGIILSSNGGIVDQLSNGVEIAATITRVDTENGSLLTIDPKTIAIMAPEVAAKTSFDIDSIFGSDDAADEEAGEDDALTNARMTVDLLSKTPVAKLTPAQKKELKEAKDLLASVAA